MVTAGVRVLEDQPGDGAGIQRQPGYRLRQLKISPHPAYGDRGITGKIPPGMVIIAEVELGAKRGMGNPNE